ncbi:chemotaxis protein [Marinobacter sp. EhC06]|uniref:anti-phage ZorAB system protein ZorA n=1 Tax=Marinobacter TaxID=2742 RepID=UPI0007D99A80|nr:MULTISPECIES: anti-phage ZorAB system protein ZorA [unclassified Marinobacter]OAN92659.1 chemotaxis protein [Marinobacter sp. EhN04]OAN95022.1 chemotaxis protein [Marinobacter sp. EhC06]
MEFVSLLEHLLPSFSKLSEGSPQGLATLFWLLMIAIFLISVVAVTRHFIRFNDRFKALRSLISDQDKQSLAANRREVLQRALGLKQDEVGKVWREFDESLVVSGDQRALFNTLDADHFFNARTLAPGLTGSRLLAAAPSFLVAIGVLGTFVGLTVGLDSLDLKSDSEISVLRNGIDQLIQGATVAFMTSVWGVGLSLLLNVLEKFMERSALSKIKYVQQEIDFLYPRIPAEQSLVHIADSSRESKEALQELHERIGDRLQESIKGVSDSMEEAFTTALDKIMAPAIDSLVTNASQQSTQALERLVGDFVEGVSGAAKDQGAQLERASSDVNTAVKDMSSQLGELFTKLNEQQERQIENSRQQAARFDEQISKVADSSSDSQKALEERFTQLMTSFAEKVEAQLESADRRNEQASAGAIDRQKEMERAFSELTEDMVGRLNSQMSAADSRETARQERFAQQSEEVAAQQQHLLREIAESVKTTQQQSIQLAEQHKDVLNQLGEVATAVSESSKHMDSSSHQLGLLSSQVKQATDTLGTRMTEVLSVVESAGEQNSMLSERLGEQSRLLEGLQQSIRESIEQYGEAAKLTNEGFTELKDHQQEWLRSIKTEFGGLSENLANQVSEIEKQAESWLSNYSSQVNQQIEDRMEKWNQSSRAYADSMLRVVENMNSILDELESR